MGNKCCGSESNKELLLTTEKNKSARVREQDHAKRVAAMQASVNGAPVVTMTAGPDNGLQPSKDFMPTARRASSDLSKTSPHYAEKLPTYKEALAAASSAANQPSTGKDLSNALTLPDEGSWI